VKDETRRHSLSSFVLQSLILWLTPLTPANWKSAHLIAEGLTNQQIAEESSFLSVLPSFTPARFTATNVSSRTQASWPGVGAAVLTLSKTQPQTYTLADHLLIVVLY
jgi:hypothetical protein